MKDMVKRGLKGKSLGQTGKDISQLLLDAYNPVSAVMVAEKPKTQAAIIGAPQMTAAMYGANPTLYNQAIASFGAQGYLEHSDPRYTP